MLSNKIIQRLIIAIRHTVIAIRIWWLRKVCGMHIGKDVRISLKAFLDMRNPKGVHIGDGSYIAFRATILCHDMSRNIRRDVKIGKNCFIGSSSILMPGVELGDSVVVAAGAVVTKNVPSGCIVAGNPAKIIREQVSTIRWGRIIEKETSE